MKKSLAVVAIVIAVLLWAFHPAASQVPPGTPDSTVCKAELSPDDIANFQRLFDKKDVGLRILEGCAFATVASLRQKNYLVVLRCVNLKNFIVIVKLAVTHNKHVKIVDVEATDERHLPA